MRATPLGLLITAPALFAAAAVPSTYFGTEPSGDVETSTAEAVTQIQRAYWLEEHEGSLEEARALYVEASRNQSLSDEQRKEASRRSEALTQDILAADLTQVLPPDAIAYLELSEPGENIASVLSQLGIYGHASESGRFGISPDLVEGLIGIKGAALAITGIPADNGVPTGVLVLHPGDLKITRGLIESVLPAQGRQVEAVEGYTTWAVPVERGLEVMVTMTERLIIASNDPYEIGAVIERMRGDDEDTLANNEELATALRSRKGALLSACLNAKPILPMIQSLASQAASQEPEMGMALAMVDLPSLRSLGAFVTAGDDGLGLEIELGLKEGHRNLVFDLFRRPNVQRETLALVPEGAAFAVATAMNPEAEVAPLMQDVSGRPIVTLLDLGRELFSNVIDVALFGMPSDSNGGSLPEVALVVRSNDASRTAAMLELALGLATQASSQGREAAANENIAGVETSRFSLEGVPLFMASEAGRVILSPSRDLIARTIDAAAGRGSLLTDELFQPEVDAIDGSGTLLVLASPARLALMALPFSSGQERQQLQPMAGLLADSVLSATMRHDDTRLGLELGLRSLPDVSALVARALHGEDPFGSQRNSSSRTALIRADPESPLRVELTSGTSR